MWQPEVDKLQCQSESERLKKAEKYIIALNETVVDLEKRVKELEKKDDK